MSEVELKIITHLKIDCIAQKDDRMVAGVHFNPHARDGQISITYTKLSGEIDVIDLTLEAFEDLRAVMSHFEFVKEKMQRDGTLSE